MATITTTIDRREYREVAGYMAATMKGVASVTVRPQRVLVRALQHGELALAYDNDHLVGWLLSEPYDSSIQELGMAYIEPNYRNQGILGDMINQLITHRPTTFAITYEPRLVSYLVRRWGFQETTILNIVCLTRCHLIFRRIRSLRSVVRHVGSSKPRFLVRNSHDSQ